MAAGAGNRGRPPEEGDGGGGNDTIDGGAGLDNFYAGAGDDIVNFGVDENGTGTYGHYYSEAGNDNLNMNNEWTWLHYDYKEETATTPERAGLPP